MEPHNSDLPQEQPPRKKSNCLIYAGVVIVGVTLVLCVAVVIFGVLFSRQIGARYYTTRGLNTLQDQPDQAIAHFSRAIEQDPAFPWAYLGRAYANSVFEGDFDQASVDLFLLSEAEMYPLDEAYGALMLAYLAKGDLFKGELDQTNAIADFTQFIERDLTQAIERDPDEVRYYYGRGHIYALRGDHDQAIADFTRAIELDPNDATYYVSRGQVHWSKGDYDQAIADCNRAIELDPEYAAAYHFRGRAYRDKGDLEQAIRDLEAYLELAPDDEDREDVEDQIKELEAEIR